MVLFHEKDCVQGFVWKSYPGLRRIKKDCGRECGTRNRWSYFMKRIFKMGWRGCVGLSGLGC